MSEKRRRRTPQKKVKKLKINTKLFSISFQVQRLYLDFDLLVSGYLPITRLKDFFNLFLSHNNWHR